MTGDMSHISVRPAAAPPFWRDAIREAIRFWEPARIAYCILLAVMTLAMLGLSGILRAGLLGWLHLLAAAILANVLYTFAYPVDLMLNAAGLPKPWRRAVRVLLWCFGTVLACWLAIGAAIVGVLDFGTTYPWPE